MADRTVKNTGGLSSDTGTYVEGILPTSADKIILNASSGNFTADSTLACRSIRCDGYTGNFTHNAGVAINIGDATSADDDIALRFSAGMTYTKLHPATSAINFISTSATQQQIETNGKILGNTTQNGAGSSYILNDNLVLTPYFATLTTQAGTINTNDKTVTAMIWTQISGGTKVITLGASVIHLYPSVSESLSWANTSGITITSNTATVHVYRSPTNPNGSTFIRVPSTIQNYLTLHVWGGGIITHASGGTNGIFANTYYHGAPILNGIDDRVQMNVNVQVSGTVNILGYSAERRFRVHNGGDFILPNNTALYCEYTDFHSVNIPTYTVDLSAMLGGTGDLGNNSGIIFTPSIDCYWYQGVKGERSWTDASNWYLATGGTGGQARKPLAQDNCFFDSNSFPSTGCTVKVDSGSLRMGGDIDWTGSGSKSPVWSLPSLVYMYGSLEMESGVSISAPNNATFIMEGSKTSSSYTLKNADVVWNIGAFLINLVSTESCSLLDDFVGGNQTVFQVNGQLIDFNNMNVTTGRITAGGTAISFGSGTKKVKGNGTVFSCTTTTVNANTGIIEIDSQDNVAKTFAGGGKSYGALKISGNYDDTITFTGSNTFASQEYNFTSSKNIVFTASTTTTTTGTITKTTGALWNLRSTTATAFTWSKASGSVTFVDAIISRSTASGGATFTANTDSIDGGGNTGWSGFVTNDFNWTNGDGDNDYNNPLNWYGGNVPTSTDTAIFTALSVANCDVPNGIGFSVKGFILTSGYTGSITGLGDQNMSIGSDGIQINGGTLVATGNPTVNGSVILTNGTLNLNTAAFTVLSQGSSKPTISITGGTLTHNNNTVYIESGSGEAIVNTTSGRPFGNLVFFDALTYSGISFVDLTFTMNSGVVLNSDVSVKGDCSGHASIIGTGIVRLIGTTTQSVSAGNFPNLQINGSSTITLGGNIIVDETLTLTAVGTVNANNIICKGNISSAVTSTLGTTNTLINGTLKEQSFTGVGVLLGDIEIDKSAGLFKLISNFQPCNTGKDFTVTQGQFNTNDFNCVFMNDVTVTESSKGIFYKTMNSSVQINGSLNGRIINRQKLYSSGITI